MKWNCELYNHRGFIDGQDGNDLAGGRVWLGPDIELQPLHSKEQLTVSGKTSIHQVHNVKIPFSVSYITTLSFKLLLGLLI
jgi:hypothetical protein